MSIDLLGNWRSAGFRRIFCSVQSVLTAALLCNVMQGKDTKHRAKETRKMVLRKFPRRSNEKQLFCQSKNLNYIIIKMYIFPVFCPK